MSESSSGLSPSWESSRSWSRSPGLAEVLRSGPELGRLRLQAAPDPDRQVALVRHGVRRVEARRLLDPLERLEVILPPAPENEDRRHAFTSGPPEPVVVVAGPGSR